jgi:hypothetical protein
VASAAAPFVVGSIAETRGFRAGFLVAAAAFVCAAGAWTFIPETKGRALAS